MSPERLAEIRARLEAATPGPWKARRTRTDLAFHVPAMVVWERSEGTTRVLTFVAVCEAALAPNDANADLIANAPTDLADLLAEVERLEQVGRVLWHGLEGLAACVEELRHPSLSPGLRARAADEADEALSTARAALAATEPA